MQHEPSLGYISRGDEEEHWLRQPYDSLSQRAGDRGTYNWYWLVDGLMDAGYRVHLAHPSAIKKYEGLKHSGDFADAAYLAQLLRLGLLAEGVVDTLASVGTTTARHAGG